MAGLSDLKLIEYTSKKLGEELNLDFSGVKVFRAKTATFRFRLMKGIYS